MKGRDDIRKRCGFSGKTDCVKLIVTTVELFHFTFDLESVIHFTQCYLPDILK